MRRVSDLLKRVGMNPSTMLPGTIAGWYQRTNRSGLIFYTPESNTKMEWVPIGDGVVSPTLKEIADAANAEGCHSTYDFHIEGLLRRDTKTDENGAPIQLPSGTYTHHSAGHNAPEHLLPFDLRTDAYVRMPNVYDGIVNDIRDFIAAEDMYRKMKIQYRRGLFLFGEPGNGKTFLIRDVIKNELPSDAVCIFLDSMPTDGFLATIKSTLGDRLKVFIFEEMVNILSSGHNHGSILDFLDGERSIDKSLIIATTNYPELIPGNIVDRPSRFDRLYRVGNPGPELRRLMLNHFLGQADEEVVTSTEGLSIAALKEVAILVGINKGKIALAEAVRMLQKHHQLVKKEFKAGNDIGIRTTPFDPDSFDD